MEDLVKAAEHWHEKGKSPQFIREKLREMNADESLCEMAYNEFKKILNLKRRKRGIVFLGAGSAFLIIGFLLTAFLFHNNESFQWVMYVVTSAGIGLLFWGIVDVLGF